MLSSITKKGEIVSTSSPLVGFGKLNDNTIKGIISLLSVEQEIKSIAYTCGLCINVGYHKKGYPKQEPKMLLKPCKNQSQKTTARSLQNSPIRSRPCAEASYERPKAPRRGPLAETLSPRPRPERPRMGCQFSDLTEAGLSNNLITSTPTGSSDKTSRPN